MRRWPQTRRTSRTVRRRSSRDRRIPRATRPSASRRGPSCRRSLGAPGRCPFGRKRIPDLGREQFVVVVAQLLSERLLFLVVPDVHASKPLQKRAEPSIFVPRCPLSRESCGTVRLIRHVRPRRCVLRSRPHPRFGRLAQDLSAPPLRSRVRHTGRRNLADLAFKVFELVGESSIVGRSAKLAPRAAVGWPVDAVIAAARPAAAEIAGHVSDLPAELAMHRDADAPRARHHHPEHLVRPLADLLGIDDVIATSGPRPTAHSPAGSMATSSGARQTRRRAAVVYRARRRSGGCWAYSDSYYDSPSSTSSAMPSPSTPMSAWPPPPPSTAGRSVRSTSPTACRPWVASNSRTCSVRFCGPNSSQRRRHRLGPRTHPPRGRRNHRRQPPELLRSGRDDHDGGEVGPQWPLPGKKEVFDTP